MTLLKTSLLVALTAAAACADTIQVTESMTTSGTLDGTAFTNELVTVNLQGDTGSVTNPSAGHFELIGVGGVNVATVGADAFTDSLEAFVNQTGGFGGIFDQPSGFVIIDNLNAGFGSYALDTSIGPPSGTSGGDPGQAYATTRGTLVLDGPFNVDHPSTFVAVVTTPEPGTLGLLGVAIGLLAFRRRTVQ
jgi:hypothetical protein